MEEAIRVFAAVNFLTMGLSHIFQHRAWAEFFAYLHQLGRPGAFANGFLSLFTGSLIVAFHNVWGGLPTVLTLLGWSFVSKAAIIFLFPDVGLRSMARIRPDNSRVAIGPGVVLVVIGVVLAYSVLQN